MKHTTRTEPVTGFIRHMVNGEQIAVVSAEDWDGYVRSTWGLDPDVVAVLPNKVANFPGDKSSGTPARLFSKEEVDVFTPIEKEEVAGPVQVGEIRQAEVSLEPAYADNVVPIKPS